jgi:hypothetical protein
VLGVLEQLDDVAGGVLEQDLLAAGPGEDLVPERHTRGPEAVDLGRDVVDDQVDAVPHAGAGGGAVEHRLTGRAARAAEEEPQVAPHGVGEHRREVRAHLEAEVGRVEVDGGSDVVDQVADADELFDVGHGSSSAVRVASRKPIRMSSSAARARKAG